MVKHLSIRHIVCQIIYRV